MARWRQPSVKSSPYITSEGYRVLEQEVETLWKKRTEVTKALAAAAAEGDRSENAEYIYRKKELRGIDSRIAFLQRRMPTLNIVTEVNSVDRIYFGAYVKVADENGKESEYRIVGSDELDIDKDYISIDSPLAQALLGKTMDDEITVSIKEEKKVFHVIDIRYE